MKESSFFHRYKEIILGLAMIAFAAFYLNQAMLLRTRNTIPVNAEIIPNIIGISLKVNAKLIPALLGALVIVLGVLQLLAGIKYLLKVRATDKAEGNSRVFVSKAEGSNILPIVLTFIIILGYAAVFESLGFVISSTICMFCQMLILSPKSKRRPIYFFVISVVVALVVYIAFRKGLELSLPAGILEGVLPL